MKETFRVNNFDIIRLLAAFQVAVHHATYYLKVDHKGSMLFSLSGLLPGVPIFFFISGFLISKSYENNSSLKEYAQNRILRIYPALIMCTFVALVSVYVTGYFDNKNISFFEYIIWVAGQVSFVQFYNPDFMRELGTGVLNGSLWTISVELQFYVLVPMLYWFFGLAKPGNNRTLLFLILFFVVFNLFKHSFNDVYANTVLFKIFGVSFAPWMYMFLVGVFFQKNFEFFHGILSGKVLCLLPLYLLISYGSRKYYGWDFGNGITPVIFILLAVTTFSFAYSFPSLSKRYLKGNDISYGVYIYHIPIVNLLMYYGYMTNISSFYFTIIGTIILAVISWVVVEKRCIKLKKRPFNPS